MAKNDFRDIIDFLSPKEKDYMKYINEHVANVHNVWKRVKLINFQGEKEETLVKMVDKAVETHDISKYMGNEFTGYRQYFFPEDGTKKDKAAFEKAWNSHQKANSHHWQYHLLFCPDHTTKALYMPTIDTLEMLSDWAAMSIKFENVPSEWYAKNKEFMLLHPTTKDSIEVFMPMFDEAVDLIIRGVPEPEIIVNKAPEKKKKAAAKRPTVKKTLAKAKEKEKTEAEEKKKEKKKVAPKKKATVKKEK